MLHSGRILLRTIIARRVFLHLSRIYVRTASAWDVFDSNHVPLLAPRSVVLENGHFIFPQAMVTELHSHVLMALASP